MTAFIKIFCICLITAGMVCFAAAVPAAASTENLKEAQREISGTSREAEAGAPEKATTVVTAVIEAPALPDAPEDPATGDSSHVTLYWILLAIAGTGIIVASLFLFLHKR